VCIFFFVVLFTGNWHGIRTYTEGDSSFLLLYLQVVGMESEHTQREIVLFCCFIYRLLARNRNIHRGR
jgi:hypothetical protein